MLTWCAASEHTIESSGDSSDTEWQVQRPKWQVRGPKWHRISSSGTQIIQHDTRSKWLQHGISRRHRLEQIWFWMTYQVRRSVFLISRVQWRKWHDMSSSKIANAFLLLRLVSMGRWRVASSAPGDMAAWMALSLIERYCHSIWSLELKKSKK